MCVINFQAMKCFFITDRNKKSSFVRPSRFFYENDASRLVDPLNFRSATKPFQWRLSAWDELKNYCEILSKYSPNACQGALQYTLPSENFQFCSINFLKLQYVWNFYCWTFFSLINYFFELFKQELDHNLAIKSIITLIFFWLINSLFFVLLEE